MIRRAYLLTMPILGAFGLGKQYGLWIAGHSSFGDAGFTLQLGCFSLLFAAGLYELLVKRRNESI